jgi:hypothetical protein
MGRNATYAMVMKRQSTETAQNLILDEVTPQFVPGRRPRTSPPPIEASELGVNVFEPVMLMTEVFEDLELRNTSKTVHRINDVINVQGHTARTSPSPAEALALNVKNVNEFNVPMDEVHEDLNAAKLLSEINEHMKILIDTYGRTTGMRAPPIEALALRMMTIMNEIDVQTDGIIKGDESANMTTDGILMDLEQVHPCTTSTTSAASTVQASSVMANIFEPDVPMASDFPTTEVDADGISMPTTPESGRTTTSIEGLNGHRVHLPKSET